jgi:hypothetical protein
MRTLRTLLAAVTLTGLTLASVSVATGAGAATKPEEVTIAQKARIEVNDPNFTQIAVSLKVTCDPAQQSQLALDVFVNQGNVAGFGFVPSVSCTGKAESVVAHVQSNFGSTYSLGKASVQVLDFVNNLTFQGTVKIVN